MKTAKNLEEAEAIGGDFYEEVKTLVELIGLDDPSEGFDYNFGGDCHLVETAEDLKSIDTLVPLPDGSSCFSLFEKASVYDVCSETESQKFIQVVLISNNSGGATYFIPVDIAANCPTVQESIELTRVTS